MEENNIHKTNPLLDENPQGPTRGKRVDHKSRVSTRTRTNHAVSNTSNGVGTKKQ
jgi:hypothetical protein